MGLRFQTCCLLCFCHFNFKCTRIWRYFLLHCYPFDFCYSYGLQLVSDKQPKNKDIIFCTWKCKLIYACIITPVWGRNRQNTITYPTERTGNNHQSPVSRRLSSQHLWDYEIKQLLSVNYQLPLWYRDIWRVK